MLVRNVATYLLFALTSVGVALSAPMAHGEPVPADYKPSPGSIGTPPPIDAVDPAFYFMFSGPGISGSGVLNAVLNADGTSYTAISGVGKVTSSDYTGSFELYPNPKGTGQSTSPSGYFFYDDQLLPNVSSLVDNNGLLFVTGGSPSEINIYSNGNPTGLPDVYYTNDGFNEAITFSVAPVPLPATASIGFGMFVVFGGLAAIRKRLNRSSRIVEWP